MTYGPMGERIALPPTSTEREVLEMLHELLTGGAYRVGNDFVDPDDDWVPIYIIVDKMGGALFTGDAHKHDMVQLVAMIARATGAIGVGMAHSAWSVAAEDMTKERAEEVLEYQERGGKIEDLPERREIVIVALYTASQCQIHTARIERREGKPPLLGEFRKSLDTADHQTVSGAMVDPIQESLMKIG